jgi:hypothetical protein
MGYGWSKCGLWLSHGARSGIKTGQGFWFGKFKNNRGCNVDKYGVIDEQDREFIKEVAGDYAEDIMDLVLDYMKKGV